MSMTVEAVYENGVFRPLQAVELAEGARVQVHLPLPSQQPLSPEEAEELKKLAHSVFEGMSDEEYEEMAKSWRRGS